MSFGGGMLPGFPSNSNSFGMGNQGGPQGAPPPDRAQRSVFVGNIPYDATEEQLREVFEQAGPVKSFRLVYDRESGKPKGYGFCEYQDSETAQSAMRNLANVEFSGRPLRVGVAAGEQQKDDGKSMQQAIGTQAIESPYGEPVEPEKAPEAISKAVASLPPEQMFELMKQMKLCVQNNPGEARNMLLQNPQLAYALLQAQIVMKIVDPQVAMSMLYRDETQPRVSNPIPLPIRTPQPQQQPPMMQPPKPPMDLGPSSSQFPMPGPPQSRNNQPPMPRPSAPPGNQPPMSRPPAPPSNQSPMYYNPRSPEYQSGSRSPDFDSGSRPPMSGVPPMPRPPAPPSMVPAPPSMVPAPMSSGASGQGSSNPTNEDQEKAALIMQVLQLTDDQIALLPPEQRQSILILKEQIKSG